MTPPKANPMVPLRIQIRQRAPLKNVKRLRVQVFRHPSAPVTIIVLAVTVMPEAQTDRNPAFVAFQIWATPVS